MKLFIRTAAATALAAMLTGAALAEKPAGSEEKVISSSARLSGPIRFTMKQVLARDQNVNRPPALFPRNELETPSRENLPQNPKSPNVSSWPNNAAAPHATQFGSGPLFGGRGGPLTLTPSTSWETTNFGNAGLWPPDATGAVGPTQVMSYTNDRMTWYSKTGTAQVQASNSAFWTGFLRAGSFPTDPQVVFDRVAQRWVLAIIDATGVAGDTANRICIAVSDGPTISGATVFSGYFTSFTGRFLDYPSMGVDNNAAVIGFNSFSNTGAYQGGVVVGFPKTALYAHTLTGVWAITTSSVSPRGISSEDASSTTSAYLGLPSATFGQLRWVRVNSSATTTVTTSVFLVNVPTTHTPLSVTPLGSTRPVSALDDRIISARVERDLSGTSNTYTCWAVQSIGVDNTGTGGVSKDRTASRWYQLNLAADGTPSLRQSGTVYDGSTNKNSYWMGSIAMSLQGHMTMASTSGGPSQQLASAGSQKLGSAALGTNDAPINFFTPGVNYNDTSGLGTMRWGDYSQTVVDPADGMTFWTFQEVAKTGTDWAVRATKLLAPPPAAASTVSPSSGQGGEAVSVTLDGTSSGGSAFFDPGAAYASRPTVTVSGTGVTVSNVVVVSSTQCTFTATVSAGAAEGARDVTFANGDGQTTTASGAFTVVQPHVSSVSLPATLASGSTTELGTVNLDSTTLVDRSVTLSSDSAALSVPASVTVPAGSSSATFSLTASVVGSPTTASVTAELNGTKSGSTEIHAPEITDLTATPGTVAGGVDSVHVEVTIDQNAPAGGVTIPITTSNSAVSTGSITIAEGSATGSTDLGTTAVNGTTGVDVSAVWQGVTKTGSVSVTQPVPSSASFNMGIVPGGSDFVVKLTVTMPISAPDGGFTVDLASDNASLVLPATMKIPFGSSSATITVTHLKVRSDSRVKITASTAAGSTNAYITLTSSGVGNLIITPRSPYGGSNQVVTGTITLKKVAGPAGVDVSLVSLDSDVEVPASVHVDAGMNTATFPVTTHVVWADKLVEVQATYLGMTQKNVTLRKTAISLVAATPKAIKGTSPVQAYVKVLLNMTPGSTPVTVSLTSDNPSVASVPATYDVPVGQNFVLVPVTKSAVATDTVVTITATLPTGSKSGSITIKS